MTIHKEGYRTLIIVVVVLTGMHLLFQELLFNYPVLRIAILVLSIAFFLLILQFFRSPDRTTVPDEKKVYAPADGKVVVIEEADEPEALKDRRIQISIFMSPLNVHINRYPVSGKVTYVRYHKGSYLVAWHPKSSTENERSTVVIEMGNKARVLIRQIAGAVARRVVCYPQPGLVVLQGEQMGFIKFGSRVDIFLPLGAKINVKLNQAVVGGETVLAEFV